MANSGIKIVVSGRVQGVGFRYFTYHQAKKLHLSGYVRNLANGQVEIVACGQQENIDDLLHWLEQGGPSSASIEHYDMSEYSGEDFSEFSIKY